MVPPYRHKDLSVQEWTELARARGVLTVNQAVREFQANASNLILKRTTDVVGILSMRALSSAPGNLSHFGK
jgi:hypothetical protein